MTNEPRAIWIRTKNGVVQGMVWAMVKRGKIAADYGHKPGWIASALTDAETEADGWDAQETLWRRGSPLLGGGHAEDPESRVEGRHVTAHGCRWDLLERGDPHPNPKSEPLEPAPEVVDEERLLAFAERHGPLALRHKGGLLRVAPKAGHALPAGAEVLEREGGKAKRHTLAERREAAEAPSEAAALRAELAALRAEVAAIKGPR